MKPFTGYFLEVDVEYPKKLSNSHKDLPFLPETQKNWKSRKACLWYKWQRVFHIRAIKQALNHGLKLKEAHRIIKFKLMINSVFGKTMENVRKHRDIKLVTTEEQIIKSVSEPNYHTTKHFTESLLGIEMKKTKVRMNKPLYLGMTILDISKILMYKFCYEYIKPKYGDSAKLCYTDTDSFIIYIFIENVFDDIARDLERWFGTSNCDENDKRPLPIGKNKKVYVFFKDELGGKIMKEFCALRPKAYANLMDDDGEKKKNQRNKKMRNKT